MLADIYSYLHLYILRVIIVNKVSDISSNLSVFKVNENCEQLSAFKLYLQRFHYSFISGDHVMEKHSTWNHIYWVQF